MLVNGQVPECPTAIEMVGYLITAACHKVTKLANDRATKTIATAKVVASAPLNMAKQIKATIGKVLPSYTFGTNWSTPSMALSTSLRGKMLTCIWGKQIKMRCPEIVLGLLNDPTKVDNFYASAFRAFILARRILRKNSARYDAFIDTSTMYGGKDNINGPVHGLYQYANVLGILITIEAGVIMMLAPLGAKLLLCTSHETHFKSCIRESCRYLMFKRLANGLAFEDAKAAASLVAALKNPNVKHKRVKKNWDDMLGMHPYVDIEATRALSVGRKRATHAYCTQKLASSVDEDANGFICQPCKLDGKTQRGLQTIIAGIIRTPHRLKYTGRVSTHQCPHAGCRAARCDTEHLFWTCPASMRWTEISRTLTAGLNAEPPPFANSCRTRRSGNAALFLVTYARWRVPMALMAPIPTSLPHRRTKE